MSVTERLTEISHAVLVAIGGRDAAALDRHLADDFVHIGVTGDRQEKRAFIAGIQAGDYRIERLTFDTLAVEPLGAAAVVCGVQRASVVLVSGERVEGRTAFTDVFVRQGGEWRLRLATSVELTA